MLRAAVTDAARDHAHLQAVAGRSVHVMYLDAVLAAADVLDERAWDDLADAWEQLAASNRRARPACRSR